MSLEMEDRLSDEEYLQIETHMLGAPLSVYKLKLSYIRFIRRIGLFIFWFGVVVLVFAIVGFFRGKSDDQFALFIMTLLPASYAMLKGGVFYRIEVKRARRMRVILCEQGLLYVSRKIRSDFFEVVRWKDILKVKKELIGKSYSLILGNSMPITLSSSFENLDKLVATIRERSGLEEA